MIQKSVLLLSLILVCVEQAAAQVPLPWEQSGHAPTTASAQSTPQQWPYSQSAGQANAPSKPITSSTQNPPGQVVQANYQSPASGSSSQDSSYIQQVNQSTSGSQTPSKLSPPGQIETSEAIALFDQQQKQDPNSPLSRSLRRPGNPVSAEEGQDSEAQASPASFSSVMWTLCVLVVTVFGLIFGMQFYARRQPGGARSLPTEAMELLGRRAVDPRHAVQMIRCGTRILIVGISADGMQTLAEVNDPIEVDALSAICRAGSVTSSAETLFQQVFQRQWGTKNEHETASLTTETKEPRLAAETLEQTDPAIRRQHAVELSAELEQRFREQQRRTNYG